MESDDSMTLMEVKEGIKNRIPCPPKSMQTFIERMEGRGFRYLEGINSLKFEPRRMNSSDLLHEPLLGKLWRKTFHFHNGEKHLRIPDNLFLFTHAATGLNVMVEYGRWNGITVQVADPRLADQAGKRRTAQDRKTGLELKKGEILNSYHCSMKRMVGFEGWIDATIDDLERHAGYKNPGQLFGIAHGHDGWKRGERLFFEGKDDGTSEEADIALAHFRAHKKWDARGGHNFFDYEHYEDMCRLLGAMGIVKIPAVEVTLPVFLFDNISILRFVRDINGKKERLNDFVDRINAEKDELAAKLDEAEAQIAAMPEQFHKRQKAIDALSVTIAELKGAKKTAPFFTVERRIIIRRIRQARHAQKKLRAEYEGLKPRAEQHRRNAQEIATRLAQLKGEKAFARVPEEGVALPKKSNGGYDIDSVKALMGRYADLIKVYNSHVETAHKIAVPGQSMNGPHFMVYAETAELMKEIHDNYLANKIFDYPAYASQVELKHFIRELRENYGQRVAIGMAHPVCFSNGGMSPAVGILDSARRGDVSWSDVMERIVPYIDTVGAFNMSISNTKKFLMEPWGEERLQEVRSEKGEEAYHDEVDRAFRIAEFKARLQEVIDESDRDIHTGREWTVGTLNMAFAHYLSKHHGVVALADEDIHTYLRPKATSPYIDAELYGWSVLELPGGFRDNSPAEWVSAIHAARNGTVEEIRAFPNIYADTNNKQGAYDVTHERKDNRFWETAREMWNYGTVGMFMFGHDFVASLSLEKPRRLKQAWNAFTRLFR